MENKKQGKTIHLIRHAESEHNRLAAIHGDDKDFYLFDATLSKDGFSAAKAAREHVSELKVDLVVCSPLSRAILTMKEMFRSLEEGKEVCSSRTFSLFSFVIFFLSLTCVL